MIQNPKLIVLDLDGTLLTIDKKISPRNLAAVKAAVAAGIRVTIATGRMHDAALPYAHQLGVHDDDAIISYNGARVQTVGGEIISETPVNATDAEWLIHYTDKHDLHLNFYHDDILYTKKMDKWSDLYYSRTGSVITAIGDLTPLIGKTATKLLIVDTLEVTTGLVAPMKQHYGDTMYITKSDDEYLEFMNPHANKGVALVQLAASLGIPIEQTVAFGDNFNDIPMLEAAGWGIAMNNAHSDVKAHAKAIAPDHQEDGVAQVIERMLE